VSKTSAEPSVYVHDAMLHKLPENVSDTDIRSPYTITRSVPYAPKTPILRPSISPKQFSKKHKTTKTTRFKITDYPNDYFDVPTQIRLLTSAEHNADDVNRIDLLKDELLYILQQPVGSILQDMVIFKDGTVHDDDDYNFTSDDIDKITMYVEDILLAKKYDQRLYDLHEEIEYSKSSEKKYVAGIKKYANYLQSKSHTPFYELIHDEFYLNLNTTYADLLATSNDANVLDKTLHKYHVTNVYLIIQAYLENRVVYIETLPKTLNSQIANYIEKYGSNIKSRIQFETVLLEVSKMICVHIHTNNFEYIILLILSKFITQKQRISCNNKCPALKHDGFHAIEIGKKDIGAACVGLYTKLKQQLGQYELNFFVKVLRIASDGKCIILKMSGGKKQRKHVMIGPKGGKYTMVRGKKRYL
jgi:hypothetical protein